MSLYEAFFSILSLVERPMTLGRPGGVTVQVKAAVSNYSRHTAGLQDTTIEGREFTISAKYIPSEASYPGGIRRGDFLTDLRFGSLGIIEVIPMMGLGGAILGYRLRTG